MIIVYTGDGKGKTEAAFGLALRAVGTGLKTAIVQFMKTEEWWSGERNAIRLYSIPIDIYIMGAGFSWDRPKGFKSHEESAKKAWEKVKSLIRKGMEIIICDEINVALKLGFLNINEVCSLIESSFKERKDRHICMTGRDAPKDILEISDYVTEFVEVKHPFSKGIKAIKGIDY